MTRAVVAGVLFALPLASTSAHAESEDLAKMLFVSPGVVWSWHANPGNASGTGFEVSFGYTPLFGKSRSWIGSYHVGAVYRVLPYEGDAGAFVRHTFAAEVGLPFVGIELGYSTRTIEGSSAYVGGPHVSPYASIGILYAGPACTFTSDGPEWSFNLGLKLPVPSTIYFVRDLAKLAALGGMTQ